MGNEKNQSQALFVVKSGQGQGQAVMMMLDRGRGKVGRINAELSYRQGQGYLVVI
jgi:hypothetical protein